MARTKLAPNTIRWHSLICDVVRDYFTLVSSRQLACHFETIDGKPDAIGYFLALWSFGACRLINGRELLYPGPFATQIPALLLLTSAQGLRIIELKSGIDQAANTTPPTLKHQQPALRACQKQVAPGETVHQGDNAIAEVMNKVTSTDIFAPPEIIALDDVALTSSSP